MTQSKIHSHMTGRIAAERGPVNLQADVQLSHADLNALGVDLQAMDAALIGGGLGGVPGYIGREPLETWLPGTLRAITQVRNIDTIAGITTIGRWEDEAIKVRLEEPAGQPELYGDNANIPLADFRTTIESRGIVRFELGFRVGQLEQARLSANGFDGYQSKRRAVQEAMDISRNAIGFNGFHSDTSNVYGLLNDPNLPAYAGSATWLTADYETLVNEVTEMVNQLEEQSGGHVREDMAMTLVLPTGYRGIFNAANELGYTFRSWLRDNYPNMRIVHTPEFKAANGDLDVAYLFVDAAGEVDDSDVESSSLIQAVPVRYQVIGSEQEIKGYLEDATNATAGVFVLRPWAFARRTISQ